MNGLMSLPVLVLTAIGLSVCICVSQWRSRGGGVGLTVAYLLNFLIIHLTGAAIYVLPWYTSPQAEFVELGFEQSVIALAAFTIGSVLVAPFAVGVLSKQEPEPEERSVTFDAGKSLIVIGLGFYFVLAPVLGRIPSISAVLSLGWGVLLSGLCLKLWQSWERGDRRTFFLWLATTLCAPFITVIFEGFLGYGTSYFILVLSFIATFYRPRWHIIAAGLICVVFGLSFYVTYMRDRATLRGIIADDGAYSDRVEQVIDTASSFEVFDIYNEEHLIRIDDRLNQNILVGAAVDYLRSGRQAFANGETLWMALIAVVPRAIWPDKPVQAGSAGLVTEYTGIVFAEGTSVGVGQVMEFYINFGTTGVAFGFFVLGTALGVLDCLAKRQLLVRDIPEFGAVFLVGFSLINPGGSLVEISAAAAAAIVLGAVLAHYHRLRSRESKTRSARVGPLGGGSAFVVGTPRMDAIERRSAAARERD